MGEVTATSGTSSMGFAGWLTILFIALKLTGVISWSWVWVLSPLWISIGLLILLFVVLFVGAVVIDWWADR